MAERLTFVLDGRDDLSRVLGHAGDSAIRLRDTMTDAADGSNRAILTLTRDADGRLRDMRGQFVTTADAASLLGSQLTRTSRPMADWSTVADNGRKVGEQLKAMLISLAPAAIPAAAAMAPLVASTTAAGVAVGVYAAALGPQIAAMGEAAEAEKKYSEAVEKSGKGSKEAVAAQQEYARQMAKLPPATRTAAAALSVLKDEYKDWSDSLAQDTMAPFTKGLAVATGLLPKLTPLVRGTSAELDRMMTLLAGGMQSPGLDRLIGQFTQFSTGVLHRVNDGLVRMMRTLDTGKVGGGLTEFMAFARAQGPLVGDTLRNIAQALVNVLRAGADVGVGMLQVVNVLSKLVAAVPAEALARLFQLVVVLKLVKLAAAGMAAASAAMAAFRVQAIAAGTAAAASGTTIQALGGAFMALSRKARLAVAGTGIGLLVIALMELSERGRQVPPDVDKMTTSLGEFARTGKASGEVARVFGADLAGLNKALQVFTDPSITQSIEQSVSAFLGYGEGGPDTREAAAALDSLDQSLANLVSGGKADVAAAAMQRITAYLKSQGKTTEEINARFDTYKQALADAAFEQQIAAQAMGLFGQQAQSTKAKLDQQKASADGLRQAIQELNNVNRQGIGGMIGFEAAVDAAAKAAKDNAGSLRMVNGTLDLNSEKSRNAAGALNDLAARTDEAAASARESGASWSTVNGIYARGREKLIASAQAMGLTRDQAKRLADQILKTPDKTARLRGNMEDLQQKLAHAKNQLAKVPDSRKASVRARIDQLNAAIAEARRKLDALDGKVAKTYVVTYYQNKTVNPGTRGPGGLPKNAARGGLIRRYSEGGTVQGFPDGGMVFGPGTGTSDSIPAWLSDGEYVIRAAIVKRLGVDYLNALNRGSKLPPRRVLANAINQVPTARAMAAPMALPVQGSASMGSVEVRVFIGDREIRDIVRVETVPMIRDSEQRQAYRARVGRH